MSFICENPFFFYRCLQVPFLTKKKFRIRFLKTEYLLCFQYVFSANVMVRVATRPAENPMSVMARKLSMGSGMARSAPRLSLPGKLVFPSHQNIGHFSMLGLGDIVMPGLLLCFVMRSGFKA